MRVAAHTCSRKPLLLVVVLWLVAMLVLVRLVVRRSLLGHHRHCHFLLLDLLTSMLTIKHIGGIVYVAEAITRLLIRLGRVNQKNTFVAR